MNPVSNHNAFRDCFFTYKFYLIPFQKIYVSTNHPLMSQRGLKLDEMLDIFSKAGLYTIYIIFSSWGYRNVSVVKL